MNLENLTNETAVDFYQAFRNSLSDEQTQIFDKLIQDVYLDGWTDGNPHRSYNPTERKGAVLKDWFHSWTRLIFSKRKWRF